MGLDITAYRQLVAVDAAEAINEYGDVRVGYVLFHANPDFPTHHAGIAIEQAYRYVESMHFRAGSYGGYNAWRDRLYQLVDGQSPDAFSELVFFSDCEGTIGPVIANKLARDFATWQPVVDDLPNDEYFKTKYANWRDAFEMASDSGAVDFS